MSEFINVDYYDETDAIDIPPSSVGDGQMVVQWVIDAAQMDQPIYTDHILITEKLPACPPQYCLDEQCSSCDDSWKA